MIGSPDLLAFTTDADFLEQSTESPELPADLWVPPWPDASPWSRSAGFDKDFILVSEFSEQVGPQPLLTVPEDAEARGRLDLNRFSLRIMSVDYQTTLTGAASLAQAKLNFVEDAKVVLGDSGERAYAYVHHLTLYDPEARGFVRPFCMAYVSSEEEKIMCCFSRLSAEFSEASECLKTGNRKNFAVEVDKKLSDLEYTRLLLLREINRTRLSDVQAGERNGLETMSGASREENENRNRDLLPSANKEKLKKEPKCRVSFMEVDRSDGMPGIDGKGNEPECDSSETDHQSKQNPSENEAEKPGSASGQWIMWAGKAEELARVEKAIQEHRSLLKQISSYPNRKLRDPQFLPYEPDHIFYSLESELEPGTLYTRSPGSAGDCGDRSHTPLHAPSHTPQLVSLSKCRRFDKRLKNLDELCDKYFLQQALDQLRSIERTFRGDNSYVVSRQQTQHLLRHLKSTNFLFEDLCDLEKETGQQFSRVQPRLAPPLPVSPLQSEPISLDSYTSCVEMVPIRLELHRNGPDSVPTSPCNDLPAGPNFPDEDVSLPMKNSTSSGESIVVLGTEKSVRTHAVVEAIETVPQRPAAFPDATFDGRKRGVVTLRENSEDSIEVLSVTDSIIPEDLRASCPSAIYEETLEHEGGESDDPTCRPEDVPLWRFGGNQLECLTSASTPTTIVINPPDPHMSLDLCTSGASSEPGFFFQDTPFLYTPDDLSDRPSYPSSGSTLSLDLCGEIKRTAGSRRKRGRLGRAALKFLRQFPFALHAVYSLLVGRTLVVLGSEERAVRRLVTALTMFTPHLQRCRGTIQPWTSSPLQITDLLTWKLVGCNRSAFPSSPRLPPCLVRFGRYLSVLDVDQKTLRCPAYKGSLICPLVEARTRTMCGVAYFLYAQSIISQLVSRAFLLTFTHPGVPETGFRPESVFREFHKDDLKILLYLSNLVTQHATGTSGTTLRFSYTASTVFKI